MTWLLYVFAAVAGGFNTVQAGANAQLRKSLDQPFLAAMVVYGTALAALLVAAPFVRSLHLDSGKLAQTPWWAWACGLISIVSTLSGLMLAHKMGSAAFTAMSVTFALICAVFLDHMGWVGFEVHRATPWRIAGCALLLCGLFLISKF